MRTLPVFAIIGHAIWFVVANLIPLFRLTWLPIATLIASHWVLAYAFVWVTPGLAPTIESILDAPGYLMIFHTSQILYGLSLSVIAVRIHRIILFGDYRPDEYFAFPFGRTELFYVIMAATSYMVMIVLFSAIAIGLMELSTHLEVDLFAEVKNDRADPIARYIPLIAFVIIALTIVTWAMLRLAAWPPAVVATKRFAFVEAVRASRGNAWALFALWFFSYVAMYFALYALTLTIFAMGVGDDILLATMRVLIIDQKIRIAMTGTPSPEGILGEFFGMLLFASYTVAILSYAYKALKGFDLDAPIGTEGEPAQ